MADRLRPTELELAAGVMFGLDPEAPLASADATRSSGATPLGALEAAVLPALRRPPCYVSFSGGRDSSAVLAVAARVARREGLPAPVPVTLRFPDVRETHEWGWQELVVEHLGLEGWDVREAAAGEFDYIGPHARPVLLRHGVRYPANAFLHAPLLETARGGSLVTGVGGDQVLDLWRWARVVDVLARRVRPTGRDVLRVAYAAAPAAVRKRVELRRGGELPWLRPRSQQARKAALGTAMATEPVRWDRSAVWRSRTRALAAVRSTLGRLADDAGALVAHPLLDEGFVAAIARAGGRAGFGDRTAVMRAVFGGLLPDETVSRLSKATFDGVFWGPHARAFAEEWDGRGFDPELVDPEALRAEWRKASPHAGASMLLQAAWLRSARDRGEQAPGDVVHGVPPPGTPDLPGRSGG